MKAITRTVVAGGLALALGDLLSIQWLAVPYGLGAGLALVVLGLAWRRAAFPRERDLAGIAALGAFAHHPGHDGTHGAHHGADVGGFDGGGV